VSTKGPVVGDSSIPKDPAPARRGKLPKTGAAMPLAGAVGLGLAAYALHALRRKSAVV
jgi:LPXTG-motif cell wall-anchored protein